MSKAKGKGAGGPKGLKPVWMSEELWALQNDTPKLVDVFRGTLDKSAGARTVSKEQARTVPLEFVAACGCQIFKCGSLSARAKRTSSYSYD
jgi:hypothetical protein